MSACSLQEPVASEIRIFSLNTRIRLIAGARDSPLPGDPVQPRPAAVHDLRHRAHCRH